MTVRKLSDVFYDRFNTYAGDLYPGRYTHESCERLAEMAHEIVELAAQKQSTIAVHNYLLPEVHEVAGLMGAQGLIGDSLGLALQVRDRKAPRVDFQSVYFMGATAKMINGDATRVYVGADPDTLGCSLVFGTDYAWIERWKARNPGGVLVTYINSDTYTKSISDYVSTSRNTAEIIVAAARANPGKKVLVLPDKYLGYVMRAKAVQQGVDPEQIDVYKERFGQWNACCYVHEKIGETALQEMLDRYPDAVLLIHPECGCANTCLLKVSQGIIPEEKAYFLSTEKMLYHAKASEADTFIVATEKGMLYRLRKECPDKTFLPVSMEAECKYMKANTLDTLLRSLKEDRLEIAFCDDCCDPKKPYHDDRVIHIQRSIAAQAKTAIDRMMAI